MFTAHQLSKLIINCKHTTGISKLVEFFW